MTDKTPDFGDYVLIEQKRYGAPNEMYIYKVIGNFHSNYYQQVPVDARIHDNIFGDICRVIRAISAGVMEDKVEQFRVADVQIHKMYNERVSS